MTEPEHVLVRLSNEVEKHNARTSDQLMVVIYDLIAQLNTEHKAWVEDIDAKARTHQTPQ